ncbi:nicolin-1-like isoform X2 [Corticium candelabrum]|uniref:nicolin-1-like isoform X2 n=1 Tax=Corticium candelabrum TaxID=121492 RepID=UPI002E252D7F|nr:nicolin-1-like isoform X2 [Corticium candelabrum]
MTSAAKVVEKSPVVLYVGGHASGCVVIDVVVQGAPINLKEITFRNYYTALVTIKARIRETAANVVLSYKTIVKDFVLMPNPHCEQGSQQFFRIQADKFLCDSRNVMALRLIVRQPSHLWMDFGLRDINCFQEEQTELELSHNSNGLEEEESECVKKITEHLNAMAYMGGESHRNAYLDIQRVGRFDVSLCFVCVRFVLCDCFPL